MFQHIINVLTFFSPFGGMLRKGGDLSQQKSLCEMLASAVYKGRK